MQKIVFDLDGVLRNLQAGLNKEFGIPHFKEWFWLWEGEDIFYWVKHSDYRILTDSPPTKYLDVVKRNIDKVFLWTCQPEDWKKHTIQWVEKYLNYAFYLFLDTEGKRELLDTLKDVWLVEDSPNFSNYDRIILIDRPYNRHIKVKYRIKKPKELECLIKSLTQEKDKNLKQAA